MSKVDFKLNLPGLNQLMQSQEAAAVCKSYADRICSMAGDGFEVTTHVGKTRANASVAAVTDEARKDNLENNTLLKLLGSAR